MARKSPRGAYTARENARSVQQDYGAMTKLTPARVVDPAAERRRAHNSALATERSRKREGKGKGLNPFKRVKDALEN